MRRAAAVGLLVGASVLIAPSPADASDCGAPPKPLDKAIEAPGRGRTQAGVFETRIVASAPGFPLVRERVAYETVQRSWGELPRDLDEV